MEVRKLTRHFGGLRAGPIKHGSRLPRPAKLGSITLSRSKGEKGTLLRMFSHAALFHYRDLFLLSYQKRNYLGHATLLVFDIAAAMAWFVPTKFHLACVPHQPR